MKRLTAWILTLVLAAGCLQSIPAQESGGHTYRLVISDCTWSEAFQEALNAGGYLARFETREEYQTVLQQINDSGASGYMFRVGGRRDPDSASYYWADRGNALSGDVLNSPSYWGYSEWMQGEPSFQDGDITECFMDIYYFSKEGRWVWNDVPDDIVSVVPNYSGRLAYIIEFDNTTPQSVQPSAGSWQDAYSSFVLNQKYLNSGQQFGDEIESTYDNISFALHDLNADGTPELAIFNGNGVYAGSVNYLFQYTGGTVKYTGIMPGVNYNPYYYIESETIPGLFVSGAHTGSYWTDYYFMENGVLASEQVVSTQDSVDGPELSRTGNTALYNAYLAIKSETDGNMLPFYTLSEINNMGWASFMEQYGYTQAGGSSAGSLSDPSSLLSAVPDEFYFSSGAGGWGTDITLHDDGTFTGSYHDSDMGSDIEHYPGGTMYVASFNGKFTDFQKVDDYTWTMRLESLNYDNAPGQDWEENGVHNIASEAYGIAGGDQFYLYLQGHPTSTLPEEYLNWAKMYMNAYDNLPSTLTVYGIYNVAEQAGFGGSW